jgi:hypothetical protein
MLRVLWVAMIALGAQVQAQNTECATATAVLSLPATLDGDLTTAPSITHFGADSCALASAAPLPGNWFTFTTESDGCLTATIEATGEIVFDTILTAYVDGCDALSCAAMNDDIDAFTVDASQVNINVEDQTTYHFFVGGLSPEAVGAYTFNISQADGACERPTGNRWCPACPDGGLPDPSAIFDSDRNVSCDDMGEVFSLIEGSEICISQQIIGSVVCGCRPVSYVTCKLCPGGEDVPDPTLPTLSLSGSTTCGDINVVAGVDSCGVYKSGLAEQCQCPGSPEPCKLCPGSTTYDPTAVIDNKGVVTTCGSFEVTFQQAQVLFPISLFCEPLLIDYSTGLNVVDFCCHGDPLVITENTTFPPTALILTDAPTRSPEVNAPINPANPETPTAPATAASPTSAPVIGATPTSISAPAIGATPIAISAPGALGSTTAPVTAATPTSASTPGSPMTTAATPTSAATPGSPMAAAATPTSASGTPTAPGSTPTPASPTAPDAITEASTGTPTDVLTMVPAGTPLSIGSSASNVMAGSLLFYSVIGLLVKSYLEA